MVILGGAAPVRDQVRGQIPGRRAGMKAQALAQRPEDKRKISDTVIRYIGLVGIQVFQFSTRDKDAIRDSILSCMI